MEIKRKYYENRVLKLLREYNENFGLLTESKKEILMDKLGLKEELAVVFEEVGKKLAIWIANKYLKYYYDEGKLMAEKNIPNQQVLEWAKERLNRLIPQRLRDGLASIMDYIQVGLNGNKSSLDDLTILEIMSKSQEWHNSLGIAEGEINYKEPHTHDVILDFRKDGEGYYWVSLNTKNSSQECERMGHCGRSSYGYLYSLRSDKKLPGGKYTLNRSHLTASIGTDGILYQLKGPKNSKPKEEFHDYIQELFYVLGGGGEEEDYLIQGFGSEYASQQDFKLTDLPDQTIRELYNNRPELFSSRSLQSKLGQMGIIEVEPLETRFTLEIGPSDIGYYLDGDFVYKTYNAKTPAGNDTKRKVYYYETIMSDDVWDMYNSDGGSWKENLEYYVGSGNEKKIEEMINSWTEKEGIEIDEDMSLEDKIEEYDDNYEIRNAINNAMSDVERDEYAEYLRNTLESALNKLGNVFEFNTDKIRIQIDLKDHLSDNEIDEYFEYYEDCDNNPKCIFGALLDNGHIDKPKPRFYDYWDPDIDKDLYNNILTDRLNEI